MRFKEVGSCFCNVDLNLAPKTFRLKRQGFRPNYVDQIENLEP